MTKNTFILISILLFAYSVFAQNNKNIVLDNGSVYRNIFYNNGNIGSNRLSIKKDGENFISSGKEFYFLANDKQYSGKSDWTLVDHYQTTSKAGVENTTIALREKKANPQLEIKLHYATYPGLPLVRKWITFTNLSDEDLKIESLNIEDLETKLWSVNSFVYNNYARMKHLMKYEGDWDDAVSVVHDTGKKRGMALGNEAMGVIKRSAYHTDNNNIEIGLTHKDHIYPFRKWITPGESWTSPKTFICLYENYSDGFQVVNNEVNQYVTNNMGARITKLKKKPTFVYNTWYPFRKDINATMIRELADAAADCGIQEFVIDDGWQRNALEPTDPKAKHQDYGDWIVDEKKFPGGLKPTFDYIKSKGMKPGLWVSIASASANSKVFKEHPEWFVTDESGEITSLHTTKKTFLSASFGTEWVDYIKDVIIRLVKEHGLEYAKLDLAVVTSPYLNDEKITGSYSKHPYSRDHAESFIVFYERLLKLFDDLHEEAPDLFIDCTFETAGKVQLMDYAIVNHAEGNWLSNFIGNAPDGSLRVRQMAWWRSPAMPASSLVIGNMAMDDPNFELTLKSLIGTLPICLGDPRKMDEEQKKNMKAWGNWMNEMQEKHDYMAFRKDLLGFGEPREGFWDGWQRLNFNTKKGGVFGVFRQGGSETTRTVVLDDLVEEETYVIRKAPTGKKVFTAKGKDLMQKGFKVTISKEYDGSIFEVSIK